MSYLQNILQDIFLSFLSFSWFSKHGLSFFANVVVSFLNKQNLSEKDFLSECKESRSVSLSFGSWFLAALHKRQVFGSLQFFMGKQWFSVLAALRKKEDRDKGKFKVDDESVEKVVEVINDLRSENQSTSTQQSIDTGSENYPNSTQKNSSIT
ncbi:hypothetical protein GLOIN_2v1780034 [Rhizophagus irregularis DAOM 181602=DAOM 197198]|uniref:Uncharacterized protein n=1 Tax=Rhizophagus irregularis (strain DAOM 181602 / DAOM 197198 / MUCL 43194) TaxID=747089 RepID=A0A2P4PGH8_RHIID|nr:hypothetical protein GLOIN_2v1782908 [Rhizophagus irregularis DAOM 181602=DAOM 197198]XP_025173706.1 hypothetical protein GLOIN_2v1780034 [Rhizophagus irregularis DAOM 181602=DAOM 197198]POG64491.1 hypothetical protein GLOIN_2v1782908 [Rhizophagus irregularis DAOM 181602=DAOM 197198]POG66840.1 hypothetical protein GLOIN_2v1780034 [Rhizophagus irregularis DAOM 181602=DAOM 197198]GET59787.1 hypothetical protein GLOIN_2v1780034 [Rhizophagus irregularis DAOM 181602=DAOM 197198]|eukprot:XP_025171357.1 hypothetical protein GLOIN_2v1782908 [Rhizophagus irregularis DAOM 181602=DAOM 197198]